MADKLILINIADLPDDDDITPREKNLARKHNIAKGSLVETEDGLRLWVVSLDRDCDGTPLYGLSFDKNWSKGMYGKDYEAFSRFRKDNGYPEESLTVIKEPKTPKIPKLSF